MGRICYDLIQMHDPVETAELVAFTRTVEAKSLSRAAAELRVPRATISRRLARLEERLGTRLLRRTTRSLVLTDTGEAFYRHARIVLDAVGDAEASVRRSGGAIRGDLRIAAPPMMSESFYELVCDFARRFPEVRLHVDVAAQPVDLRRGGYDVAIRASTETEPGLVARTLARVPLVAVASPSYLEEKGVPRSRKDLRDHRCLMGFTAGGLPQTHWPVAGGGKLHVDGWFFSNEIALLGDAVMRGLGIAVLPLLIVRPFLESGELVQVLAGLVEAESRVLVVYPERELVPPQVRAFVDAVVAWAPEELGKGIPERCEAAARERKAGISRPRGSPRVSREEARRALPDEGGGTPPPIRSRASPRRSRS